MPQEPGFRKTTVLRADDPAEKIGEANQVGSPA
jgi:hypothetical protein